MARWRLVVTLAVTLTLSVDGLPGIDFRSAEASHGPQTLVPYEASGYKYKVVAHGAEPGFESPTFDDSSWASGSAAFGSGGGCALQSTVATTWTTNTDLLLRRSLTLANATTEIVIFAAVDNNIAIYWNGSLMYSQSDGDCPFYDEHIVAVPPHLIQAGTNHLAVRATDVGVESFVDLKIVSGMGIDEAQTYGSCYADIHAANPSACNADPVNTATGAFVNEMSDLRLPWVGLPFEFRRYYTSRDTTSGALGPGWTHSYAASLSVEGNGDVWLRGEDGQRVKFTRLTDGSYRGGPGVRSRLSSVTGGYELLRRDQVRYSFTSSGRLTELRDRNGNRHALSYDASGRLQTIVLATASGSATRSVTLTNNAVTGLLERVELPDARMVQYGYTAGRLTSVTDVRLGVTTYTYDAGGRLAELFDQSIPSQRIVKNVYDSSSGRVIEQIVPSATVGAPDHHWVYDWDPVTQTATVTDTRSGEWKDVYEHNVLIRRIDPLGNTIIYSYDGNLNLVEIEDARGFVQTATYDARGNMLTRAAPSELVYTPERFTYTVRNDIDTYIPHKDNPSDPDRLTEYDYDTNGNLTEITQPATDAAPGGTIWQYGRDAGGLGLLASVTDPRGKTWEFGYTDSTNPGRITSIESPLDHETTFVFDAGGRPASMVEARGNEPGADPEDFRWRFEYNATDQLTKITDPVGFDAGYFTELTYDPTGPLVKIWEAKGGDATEQSVVSYEYNPQRRLKTVKQLDQAGQPLSQTSYEYDEVGNLAARVDGLNRRTEYGYDAANRLMQALFVPTGQTWKLGHDPNGNVASLETPKGVATPTVGDFKITYGYDELSRITSINYSDATPDVAFTYDADDNRKSMTDGAGTVTYFYDALNQLRSADRDDALAAWETGAFTYEYFADGSVKQRGYPEGEGPVDYTYDDDGRLETMSIGGLMTSYTYEAGDTLKTTTLPNGVVETRGYDAAGRLTDVSAVKGATTLTDFGYTFDEVGNPTRIDAPGAVTTLTYDPMQRLDTVCFAASCPLTKDIDYAYDAVGNRLTEVRPTGTTTYSYRQAGGQQTDELATVTGPEGTITYTHDPNGNMTKAGSRNFAYDLANRLSSTWVSDALTTTTIWHEYDGDGRRLTMAKDTTLNGNNTRSSSVPCVPTCDEMTHYNWDPNAAISQLALEVNGLSPYTVKRRYAWGHDIHQMRSGASAEYYYAHDALGSVASVSDSAGATVWSYTYEPFGKLRSETQHGLQTPLNLLRYTGELWDLDTGLYHLRARQYGPDTGRFLSLDPLPAWIMDPYVASYVYVRNRPTLYADPTGELGWALLGAFNPVAALVIVTAAVVVYTMSSGWEPPDLRWSGHHPGPTALAEEWNRQWTAPTSGGPRGPRSRWKAGVGLGLAGIYGYCVMDDYDICKP